MNATYMEEVVLQRCIMVYVILNNIFTSKMYSNHSSTPYGTFADNINTPI